MYTLKLRVPMGRHSYQDLPLVSAPTEDDCLDWWARDRANHAALEVYHSADIGAYISIFKEEDA